MAHSRALLRALLCWRLALAVGQKVRLILHPDFVLLPINTTTNAGCNPVDSMSDEHGCSDGFPAAAAIVKQLRDEVGPASTVLAAGVETVSRLVGDVGVAINADAHRILGVDFVALQDAKMVSQKGRTAELQGTRFLDRSLAPVVVSNAALETDFFGAYEPYIKRNAVRVVGNVTVGFVSLWGSMDYAPLAPEALVLPVIIKRLREAMDCQVVVALCAGDQYPPGGNESWALTRFDIDIVLGPTHYETGKALGDQLAAPRPEYVNGTWLVQQLADKPEQTISTLDFTVSAGRVQDGLVLKDYNPSGLLGISQYRSSAEFREAAEWLQKQLVIAEQCDDPIANSTRPMPDGHRPASAGTDPLVRRDPCRHLECPLGNLAADALREWTLQTGWDPNASTVAIINGGGLQFGWPKGPITKCNIHRAYPFANYVCRFKTTGPELWRTIEKAVSPVSSNGDYNHSAPNKGGFPQVSGLRFEVDYSRPKFQRVLSMSVQDPVTNKYEPISRRRHYWVATLSFLCDGGDGYDWEVLGTQDKTHEAMKAVLIDYITERGEYTPISHGGRIKRVSGIEPPLDFRPLSASDCSDTERYLALYEDCEPCPPGLVHPVPGDSDCILKEETDHTVRWIVIGVILFLVVVGVGIALYCRSSGRKMEEEVSQAKRNTGRLRDINQVAKDLAQAVARMDLFGQKIEDIFTHEPPPEREKIVLAFRDIISFLREFRAFLPESVVAQAQGKNIGPAAPVNKTFDNASALDSTTRISPRATTDQLLGPNTPLLANRPDCLSATMWAPPAAPSEEDGSSGDIWTSGTLVTNALRAKEATLLRLDAGGRCGDGNGDGGGELSTRVRRFLSTVITESRRSHSVTICVGADSVLLGWNTIFQHRGVKGQHTVDACRCAEGLKRGLNEDMWSGIGIARGTVLVGYSGSENQRSPVVVGPTVHVCEGLALLSPRVHARVLLSDTANKVLQGTGETGLFSRPVDRVMWGQEGGQATTCYELLAEAPPGGAEYAQAFDHLCNCRTGHARDLLVGLLCKNPTDEQACRLLRIVLLLQSRRSHRRNKARTYARKFQGWEDFEVRAASMPLPDDLGDLRGLAVMGPRTVESATDCMHTMRFSLGEQAQGGSAGGAGTGELHAGREQSQSALGMRRGRMRDASFIRRELRNWGDLEARIHAEIVPQQAESFDDSQLSGSQRSAVRAKGAKALGQAAAPKDSDEPLHAPGFEVVDSDSDGPPAAPGAKEQAGGGAQDGLCMADVFGEVQSEDEEEGPPAPAEEGGITMGDVFGEVASEDDDADAGAGGVGMADVFGEVASEDDDEQDSGAAGLAVPPAGPPAAEGKEGKAAPRRKSATPTPDPGPSEPRKRLYTTTDGRKWHASSRKLGAGAGNISEVWQGMGDDGALVALKVLPLRLSDSDPEERKRREAKAEALLREVQLLERELRDEHVVAYLGAGFDTFRDKKTGAADAELIVVMEYCSGGSLEKVLETFGAAPVNAAQRYTADIAAGLAFLHSRRCRATGEPEPVVHGDLRGTNVLMTIHGSCRLSDIAGRCDPSRSSNALHLPPEAADPDLAAQPPVDIWSLGFLVCRLLTGKEDPCYGAPEGLLPPVQFISALSAGEIDPIIPLDIPPDARSFARSCLKRDPDARARAGRQQTGGRRQSAVDGLTYLGDHPFLVSPQGDDAADNLGEESVRTVPAALRRMRQPTPPLILLGSPPADSFAPAATPPPAAGPATLPASGLCPPPAEEQPRLPADSGGAAAPLPPDPFPLPSRSPPQGSAPPPPAPRPATRLAAPALLAPPSRSSSATASLAAASAPRRRPHITQFLSPPATGQPAGPQSGRSQIAAALQCPPARAPAAPQPAGARPNGHTAFRPRCPLTPGESTELHCGGSPQLLGPRGRPAAFDSDSLSAPLLALPGRAPLLPPAPGIRRTPL
eukprot:TRINITY_DN24806_c0_g1_i1.p1 TRINITY_DN24806_c0_g1~~TRINITY_DN24806_c0_g1_i1.p1  ORF type:complete len:1927 (+),score=472.91 TRINITY_DN24806_c0_g1_i1:85-5865(+)